MKKHAILFPLILLLLLPAAVFAGGTESQSKPAASEKNISSSKKLAALPEPSTNESILFTTGLLSQGNASTQAAALGNALQKMFAWDFGLVFKNFLANGFSLGFDYEQQLKAHLGWKARASANIFATETKGLFCASASFTAYGIWFPLSTNMKKLYLSGGADYDFVGYFGSAAANGGGIESSLTATSRLGWRFSLPFRFFLDAFIGYDYAWTFLKDESENSERIQPTGFQAGIKFSRAFKKRK